MGKVCTKCGIEKDESEFYKDTRYENKLVAACKTCKNKSTSEYSKNNRDKKNKDMARWRKNNPDKTNAIQKKYRDSHPEKISEFNKRYNLKHPGVNKARSAEYKLNHPEKVLESNIKYRNNNREKVRNSNSTYAKSEKGKEADKRKRIKRLKEMGWKPLNGEYSGCEKHHLLYDECGNKDFSIGIYVPIELHATVDHGRDKPLNQKIINIKAVEWLLSKVKNTELKDRLYAMHKKYCEMPVPTWFIEGCLK